MLRAAIAGVIALVSCGIGMMLLSETTWGMFRSSSPIGLTHLDTLPLVIGIGEALLGILVYRLLSSSIVLWPSLLLLLFIVLTWATYHVERSFASPPWTKNLLGYPAVLILGLWIGVFMVLTIQRWVAPRISGPP